MRRGLLLAFFFTSACGGNSFTPDSDSTAGSSSQTGGASASGGTASSTGGQATGGQTSGGTSNGGGSHSTGGAGTTGGSSSTGGATAVECKQDSDCEVIGDCCSCAAYPKGSSVALCMMACTEEACFKLDSPKPKCVFGRCVLDVSCDRSTVTCKMAEPSCGKGSVPSVSGSCYGECVASTECSVVQECDDCSGADQTCLTENGIISRAHCVETPTSCSGTGSCSCMADQCGSVTPCADTADGISCGGG